jgi:exosortase/archaeosortase
MQISFQNINMLQDALELGTTKNMRTVLSKVALYTSVKCVFKYC